MNRPAHPADPPPELAQTGSIEGDAASALPEQAAVLAHEIAELRIRLKRLSQAHGQAAASLAAAEASAAGSRETESHLRSELARLQADQGALRDEAVRLLQSSTTWRLVGLVTARLSRIPAPLRVLLRRSAKGAWWLATPHLMRKRLLLRRQSAVPPALPAPPEPLLIAAPAAVPDTEPTALDVVPVFRPFDKAKQNFDATADRNGRYRFEMRNGRYVYVPPRRPDPETLAQAMAGGITFSIVVPVYNTTPELLGRMVASVREQWYGRWELIIVDDASPDETTRAALATLVDPRIRVERAACNGGISAATNAAIALAQGEYVVFLDHDDELTADCLHELALAIARDEPDFVYSDEDKIDTDGAFIQPFFKPDWSPDTMMSTMFTCHVMCVRRTMFETVGGLDSAFDGSQDWDFVLRLTEHTTRITHIAKVLYHWRIIPASVAADLNAKPYAVTAGRRAREAALARRGLAGSVEPVAQMPVYFRVRYDLRDNPLISIIIPSKNNAAVLERCVQSIRNRSDYRNFEILIVDNGSTDRAAVELVGRLGRQGEAEIIRHPLPFNFSEMNNIAARKARGDILLFLNDDTEVLSGDWLDRMGGFAQRDHIGAVGAKLLYPETRQVQHSGLLNLDIGPVHALLHAPADDPGYFMRNLLEWNWVGVTGACLMVERKKFRQIGGFDESFPIAYNDVKLCFDLLDHGYYNVVCPSVELIHYESLSRGLDREAVEKQARLRREMAQLYRKSPHFYMRDPFHNPNFAANNADFGLPGE